MTEISPLEISVAPERHRSTKFTSANIRQIVNLVERGKGRDEIAEIIGVTPGTLAVTCSKLGISLRRPSFNLGTGRPRTQGRQLQNGELQNGQTQGVDQCPSIEADAQQATASIMPTKHVGEPTGSSQTEQAIAAFTVRYKGQERITELPITIATMGQLAIEAEFRGVKLPELVAQLIVATTQRDLFGLV